MNNPCRPIGATVGKDALWPYLTVFHKIIRFTLPAILLTLLMMILPGTMQLNAQAYCTMICNDDISVSIGNDCEATILYDMILEDGDNSRTCSPNGRWGFTIIVFDENDIELPTSPMIPFEYVGRTIRAKAKHWATGNACWTNVTLVDKILPKLTCPPNQTIACTASADPSITGSAQATDCSELSFSYEDTFTDLNCGNPIAQISRKWTVSDVGGNRDFCTQIISIAQPSISQVVFPTNIDDLDRPALDCEVVANDAASLLPAQTGVPTINGKVIENNGPCRLIPTYEDQIVQSCEGTYKILRTWTVVNWCSSEVIDKVQIIKVEDSKGPVINLPIDITVSTNTNVCKASVELPAVNVSDVCSGSITIRVQSPFGNLATNGGMIHNVPIGTHAIIYSAVDACGNTSSATLQVTVVDVVPPTPICEDRTIISIAGDGVSSAFVQSFDNGTFDNCCLETVLIRRMDTPDVPFGTNVSFSCEDIGGTVIVVLEATDCHANSNSCTVEVIVQDKVSPVITCPANQTIDCETDFSDLSIFGAPTASDNCGFELTNEETIDLDNCGRGSIIRSWRVIDKEGLSANCIQTIVVENQIPWNTDGTQIIWPMDYESSECLDAANLIPEALPEGFGEPEILGANACELIATSYEDLILSVEPPACFKIVRTWTVLDWCSYDVNVPDGVGRYEFSQVIKILDEAAPTFETIPQDITVNADGDDCGAIVELASVIAKDCSPNVTVTVQGDLGAGFGPFRGVQPGTYTMTYSAVDGCGNAATQDITITVKDTKKPTPVCLGALSVTLMPATPTTSPMVEIWANDLDTKSFDNCSPADDLAITVRLYNPDDNTIPFAESIVFDCNQLGSQAVELWVTDAAGNADFCITNVIIQDNSNVCNKDLEEEESMTGISGNIATVNGTYVTDVEVHLSYEDRNPYRTKTDGGFQFLDLPTTNEYTVTPRKDFNPLNGVSTFDLLIMRKHILQLEEIISPDQLIAADINRSGTITSFDMVELRKLILNIYDTYPNNTSWRFVPADYEFPVNNPLSVDFPESILVDKNVAEMVNMAFVAIKIGDLNDSAVSSGLQESISRSNEEAITLQTKDYSFEAGSQVILAFSFKDIKAITGFQFALNFDPTILAYDGYKKGSLSNLSESNIGEHQVSKGVITTSWEDVNSHPVDEETLFQFNFLAKESGKLSEVLTLEKEHLSAEIYDQATKIHPIQLRFSDHINAVNKTKLFQNQPNPFSGLTTISFYLSNEAPANLAIYNASGILLSSFDYDNSKGYNELVISSDLISKGGLLYYVLTTTEQRLVKKMMVMQKK